VLVFCDETALAYLNREHSAEHGFQFQNDCVATSM